MESLVQTVTRIIKNRPNGSKFDESLIQDVVEETIQYVCNYCNLHTAPFELRFTIAEMAMDYLNYIGLAYGEDDESGDLLSGVNISGSVQSVEIGDTTVTLGDVASSTNSVLSSHQANLDTMFLNYTSQLNSFRNFRW
jgi:hypothetical protein